MDKPVLTEAEKQFDSGYVSGLLELRAWINLNIEKPNSQTAKIMERIKVQVNE